jgi:hypothetical protein
MNMYTGRVSTPLWWIRRGVLTPLWWIRRGVLTPLWWIHRGVDFLVYLEQVSEHVDKKTSWWWKDQGGKTLQCINHRGVSTLWCILHQLLLLLCCILRVGFVMSPWLNARWVRGKPKRGLGFGREGTRGQWGTKGVSFQATWDWGGRFLSQLEGAK